jgi:hypothetical protein
VLILERQKLCTKAAYQENICQPADEQCACESDEFHDYVTECVESSCTIPEAFGLKPCSL